MAAFRATVRPFGTFADQGAVVAYGSTVATLTRRRRACAVASTFLLRNDHIEVRPSRIRGAGLGLFSRVAVAAAGVTLAEYLGRRVRPDPAMTSAYIAAASDDLWIDGEDEWRAFARYANDCRPRQRNRARRMWINARFVCADDEGGTRETRVFLETVAPLEPGDEIYVSYGAAYWREHKRAMRARRG